MFATALLQASPAFNCTSSRAEKAAEALQGRHGKGLWIGGIAFSADDIASAEPAHVPYTDDPVVDIKFTPSGRIKFARAQACRLNRTISIWLDNKLISRPYLDVAIEGPGAVIMGSFTMKTAEEFSRRISPASVRN